jgi:DNA-binding Lrp family transcriptional regulator
MAASNRVPSSDDRCHRAASPATDLRKLRYIVHFVCRSVGDYVELHHSLIEEEPNIASVTTNVIMSETKRFSGYPLKELVETVEQPKA